MRPRSMRPSMLAMRPWTRRCRMRVRPTPPMPAATLPRICNRIACRIHRPIACRTCPPRSMLRSFAGAGHGTTRHPDLPGRPDRLQRPLPVGGGYPDNCGGCDKPCSSGLCAASTCQMPGAGHLVIIGHDYAATGAGPSNLLGNAVLLASRAPTRILAYEGSRSRRGPERQRRHHRRGRRPRPRDCGDGGSGQRGGGAAAEPRRVPHPRADRRHRRRPRPAGNHLGQCHGGLRGQRQDHRAWLDGASASNSGTLRVLQGSGLFAGSARTAVSTAQTLSVVSAADPVARNVPASYAAPATSTAFQTQEVVKVVQIGRRRPGGRAPGVEAGPRIQACRQGGG